MGTTEVEFFLKQMQSNLHKASQGSVVLTHFLDEQQQALLTKIATPDVQILWDGGFDNAEHKRVLLLPKTIESNDFKIEVYEIGYQPRYLTLNHRKVLGTLLGLGIKRDCIGDIFIQETKAYFVCTKEISLFIEQNLRTISGIPISLNKVEERLSIERKLKVELHIVSSMRLDVIVASAYHLSRMTTQEMIADGLVMINHLECKNNSKILHKDDIISVRHKGRFIVSELEGTTKSERIKVQLGFWI